MEYLSNKYGLVTDNDPVTENGQLFLAHLILLLDAAGKDSYEYSVVMIEQLRRNLVKPGLYTRNEDLKDRRITSHDNLSGIIAWSKEHDTHHRKDIWKYLITHFGTYDSSQGRSDQLSRFLPFNPSNFFIWGLSAESKLGYLFFPIYLVNLILSCNKDPKNTSGKILSWVELYPLRNNWLCSKLLSYFNKKMTEQYGTYFMKEMVNIYHGRNSKEFPLNNLYGIGV